MIFVERAVTHRSLIHQQNTRYRLCTFCFSRHYFSTRELANYSGDRQIQEHTMKRQKVAQRLSRTISFAAMAGILVVLYGAVVTAQTTEGEVAAPSCERTIKADVVAFDQPFFYNRL